MCLLSRNWKNTFTNFKKRLWESFDPAVDYRARSWTQNDWYLIHSFLITAVSPCLGPNRPFWFPNWPGAWGRRWSVARFRYSQARSFPDCLFSVEVAMAHKPLHHSNCAKSIVHHTAVFIWALSILVGILFGCCIAKLRDGLRKLAPICHSWLIRS